MVGSLRSAARQASVSGLIQWKAQAEGWYKTNFDRSAFEENGGAGFVVRDCKGISVGGGQILDDSSSIPESETTGLWEAVMWLVSLERKSCS